MHVADMIRTHPRQPSIDAATLQRCIEACYDCAQICTSCADACLAEPNVAEQVRCIRLNLDCADVCAATGRVASRLTDPDPAVLREQLAACAEVCRACGDECAKHAQHMEHCRVCADACRECQSACEEAARALA